MRFIGSKRLLLKNIDYAIQQNIKGNNRLKSFCDIFSGTTIVSQYFKNKYQIMLWEVTRMITSLKSEELRK